MAQDTGKILAWLKSEGETVTAGEPIMEVETDKAVVEIEAPDSGILTQVSAKEGDEVPVAQVVAVIVSPGESGLEPDSKSPPTPALSNAPEIIKSAQSHQETPFEASPVAKRIADEHGIDIRQIKPEGGRVVKADVLAFIQTQQESEPEQMFDRVPASPKARRLMMEQGIPPALVKGTGPGGAVIERDVLAFKQEGEPEADVVSPFLDKETPRVPAAENVLPMSTTWQIMADRTTQSWVSAPHFYLMRELNAGNLISWREGLLKRSHARITYTDLLVKVVAASLVRHPRVNATWRDGQILQMEAVNIGLAMAVDDGLVVPVIHHADQLGLNEIAAARSELVERARERKLRPADIESGSITISNLGMYGVDAFNAVLNLPQAAILAVGRIAERVVPVDGQIQIQPRMIVSLTCDHRVIDGALGALFLKTIAEMVEDPLSLID
jgi:pyruvate dehydrogenase E2 component (dihydrolipoamide acetyltransferase)